MSASESVVAQGLGFSNWEDVKAGMSNLMLNVCIETC